METIAIHQFSRWGILLPRVPADTAIHIICPRPFSLAL